MKLILIALFTLMGNTYAAEIEKACFKVEGMTCAACAITLKAAVMKIASSAESVGHRRLG